MRSGSLRATLDNIAISAILYNMNIVLQPASNPLSQQHFALTIEHSVPTQELLRHAEPDVAKAIRDNICDSQVRLWGVMDGPQNENYYKRICDGDLVLFCKSFNICAHGEVQYKIKSRQIATYLWGTDDNQHTWQNIYFIKNYHHAKLSMMHLNEAMGYGQRHTVQNFSILDTPASLAKFFRIFRYHDGVLDLSNNASDYRSLLIAVHQLLQKQGALSLTKIAQQLEIPQNLIQPVMVGGVKARLFVKNDQKYSLYK